MDERTREDRIREYAYVWWEIKGKRHGYDVEDYLKAEHIVDGEDRAAVIEADYTFRRKPSRMR